MMGPHPLTHPLESNTCIIHVTPRYTLNRTRAYTASLQAPPIGGVVSYYWPSLAEINTRSRRLVNAYFKQQKREEIRQAQLIKVNYM